LIPDDGYAKIEGEFKNAIVLIVLLTLLVGGLTVYANWRDGKNLSTQTKEQK
jgi:hypothetical protein